MKIINKILKILQRLLPSPFSLAIIITFITIILAYFITNKSSNYFYIFDILSYWDKGFWELLSFAMQMMIMLVLGNILALTSFVNKIINFLIADVKTNSKAVIIVSVSVMILAYFNWGLSLIFGAIITRKIGENSSQKNIKINYPLIGAAAYSGMMVWHGGFSGSAPLKVAETNHFLVDSIGVIPIDKTILSPMNIFSAILVISFVTLGLFLISKKTKSEVPNLKTVKTESIINKQNAKFNIDKSFLFLRFFAILIFTDIIYKIYITKSFNVININFINLILLALGLWFHKNAINFLKAASKSISSSSGILIQFPIYAGIMGIMKYSGLTDIMSNFFIEISNQTTFPILTFISSGIVNIFVPSGGGQWAVQGEIIVEAAKHLGVPVHKAIMALAYGDELTNMIQPFWALPLLGLTGLKAKQIFPYTLFIMLIGGFVYTISLLIF